MKTSVDINPEIWKRVRVLAALRSISLSDAVNDALGEWLARQRAEFEGISEWVRSEIREENEAEAADAGRAVQRREYPREHPEMVSARKRSSRRRTKKGGARER